MNWNQTGMPSALVSRIGQRREIAEFKSVLNDAQNHILQPVDVESMAQKLMESGGREFVEMVRGLTTALANAKRDLEDANRRYERLAAGQGQPLGAEQPQDETPNGVSSEGSKSPDDGLAEWEEWNRRFQSLLG